jgi:glutathione S-transferase
LSLVMKFKWMQFYPTVRSIQTAQGEEARKALVEQVGEGLALLEEAFGKCSKGKAFFGGDGIGFLDIAFGCYLGGLRVTEKMYEVKLLDEAKTPGLVKWADRFCSDGAVKGVMPETEKLLEFAKVVMAKMRGAPPK